jgi:hypothetical protein
MLDYDQGMIRTAPPEIIKERIIRTQAELRRLRAELRLAEAERRDRERFTATETQSGEKDKAEVRS